MYYVQQRPELKVPAVVFSALAHLHRKTGEEIDQVSFDDISRSDLLVESMDCSQTFDLEQDVDLAFEQDIRNHRGDFGATETHWWLDFALPGGKRFGRHSNNGKLRVI
jgi:hypothetical protein